MAHPAHPIHAHDVARAIPHVVFCVVVGTAVALLWLLQSSGADLLVASTVVWVCVVVGLVVVERAAPLQKKWSQPDGQLANDLAHTALGSAVGSRVGVVVAAAVVAGVFFVVPGFDAWPHGWPFALQVALGFVVLDGVRYAQHRLSHRVPWLWETHKLHHDATRLIVIKAGRSHLLDRAMQALCVVPVVVAGASVDVVFYVVAVSSVIGLVGHANVDASGCFFFVGPNEHRVHHAKDPALHGSNFGASLTIWDRLFGTFRRSDVDAVGLDEETPSTVTGQLAAPVHAWLDR